MDVNGNVEEKEAKIINSFDLASSRYTGPPNDRCSLHPP